jgi:hypothetical protein
MESFTQTPRPKVPADRFDGLAAADATEPQG